MEFLLLIGSLKTVVNKTKSKPQCKVWTLGGYDVSV